MSCVCCSESGAEFPPAPGRESDVAACKRRINASHLRWNDDPERRSWTREHTLSGSLDAFRESGAAAQVLVGCLNRRGIRRALGLGDAQYVSLPEHKDFIAVLQPGYVIEQLFRTSFQVRATAANVIDSKQPAVASRGSQQQPAAAAASWQPASQPPSWQCRRSMPTASWRLLSYAMPIPGPRLYHQRYHRAKFCHGLYHRWYHRAACCHHVYCRRYHRAGCCHHVYHGRYH